MDIESLIYQTPEGWWVPIGDRAGDTIRDKKRLDFDFGFSDAVCEHISPGDTVIDIGASQGDHAIAYLRAVGEEGTVIAYEPHPVTFECLSRNCPKTARFPYALSDRNGDIYLHLYESGDTGSSWLTGNEMDHPVTMTTLDTHLLPLLDDPVSLIKMDAEGCEFAILKGGETLISRDHPVLVIELFEDLLRRYGHSVLDVQTFLKKHDYSVNQEFRPGTVRTDIICI